MKLMIIFTIILSTKIFAVEIEQNVAERDYRRSNRPARSISIITRTLVDLYRADKFEGQYFKIVLGKSNEAISIHDDAALVLKAATAYYHLTRSRYFWVNEMNSDYVRNLEQITIRLDITASYSSVGHYKHENTAPEYNNALSIEEGETPIYARVQDKWGKEIWFRPKQVIRVDRWRSGQHELSDAIGGVAPELSEFAATRFVLDTGRFFYDDSMNASSLRSAGIRAVSTIAMMHFLRYVTRLFDPLFMSRTYYLDSVMVPEVIYHEFSHIALSDHLKLNLSTPVLEGMADYFATRISGSTRMYEQVRGYSNSIRKNARSRTDYDPSFELNINASGDFALSLLWNVKDLLEDEADTVIYGAREFLTTTDATISRDLVRAIMRSCRLRCDDYMGRAIELMRVLELRGL